MRNDVKVKQITIDEVDEYVCACGNDVMDAGFYPCDEFGNLVEPDKNWKGIYKCANCGAFHCIKE